MFTYDICVSVKELYSCKLTAAHNKSGREHIRASYRQVEELV